ncbi:MAG: hypothetical protein ABSD28_17680 [Tepidisphaeraceae bacterium]
MTDGESRIMPGVSLGRLQARRPDGSFYFRALLASIVDFTTPAIIFRTSAGSVGQAATIAAKSASFCGFTDKPGDKETGHPLEVAAVSVVVELSNGLKVRCAVSVVVELSNGLKVRCSTY